MRIAVSEGWDVERFDAVINLAARADVRQSVENPWVYFEANVTGTLNLAAGDRLVGWYQETREWARTVQTC